MFFQFRNDTLFEKHIQTLLYKQCLSKFAQCLEVLANKTKLPSATKHVMAMALTPTKCL